MLKKYAWVLLFFYSLFLGIVMYFCALKYAALLFDLPKDVVIKALSFSGMVETVAHIATAAVFLWAIWTFREQQREKQKDEAVKRASNYSVRLINYVSDNTFRLTPSTLNVVNSYLSVLRADLNHGDVHDDVKKEVFLALMVVKEFFKNLSLKDVMGYEFSGSYQEMLSELKRVYRLPEILCDVDSYLYSRIFDDELSPGDRIKVNPPAAVIRLHQIEKLIGHLFSLSEEDASSDLSRFQEFSTSKLDNGISYPVLYAAYYFYTHAYISLDANGQIEVFLEN